MEGRRSLTELAKEAAISGDASTRTVELRLLPEGRNSVSNGLADSNMHRDDVATHAREHSCTSYFPKQ